MADTTPVIIDSSKPHVGEIDGNLEVLTDRVIYVSLIEVSSAAGSVQEILQQLQLAVLEADQLVAEAERGGGILLKTMEHLGAGGQCQVSAIVIVICRQIPAWARLATAEVAPQS